MARGRKPNLAIEPSRQLQTQRAFRERKAAHLCELESTVKRQAAELVQLRQKLAEAGRARLTSPATSTAMENHCENCLPTDRHNLQLQQAVASLEQQVLNLQSLYAVVVGHPLGSEADPSSASSSSSYYAPSYDDTGSMGSYAVPQSQSPYPRYRDYASTSAVTTSPSHNSQHLFTIPGSSRGYQRHHSSSRQFQPGPIRAFSHGADGGPPWPLYSQPIQQLSNKPEPRRPDQGSADEQLSALQTTSRLWQPFRREDGQHQQQHQQQQQQPAQRDIAVTSQAGVQGTLASAGYGSGTGRLSSIDHVGTSRLISSDKGAKSQRQNSGGKKEEGEDDCCLGIFECDSSGKLLV